MIVDMNGLEQYLTDDNKIKKGTPKVILEEFQEINEMYLEFYGRILFEKEE